MKLNSIDAKEWVLQNEVEHWSHARFTESFNNWIHDVRSLLILQLIDKIRIQMMKMAALWDTPYYPKIPCNHAYATIGSNKEAVSQYVSAFYNTEVYRVANETNIQLIPTFDMSDPPQPSDVLIKPLSKKGCQEDRERGEYI
ncbi:hypothetical protein Taro_007724 [Colocasia esculenta]|uniref:Uncharacterized protein n=1 Tax=Colocasia esculenta TaxID=4460 RepID=A0A843TW83_COLES|nr:hypothetical protein [Colocasia esculenta]